jgi:hypothetical protein
VITRPSRLSRSTTALAVRDAGADWLRSDALTWIHVLKTVTAVLLAMGISMRLALPSHGRTA